MPLKPGLSGAGVELDHSDHDQEGLTEELWLRDETLVLPLHGTSALVDVENRLAFLSPRQISDALGTDFVSSAQDLNLLYLGRAAHEEGFPGDGISVIKDAGRDDRVPLLAVMLDDGGAQVITLGKWSQLRHIGMNLDPRDTGILTRAVALANWHASHDFSPKTGNPLKTIKGGWVRADSFDGSEHFPRTDPAVIVAVTDAEDRILLASNASWDRKVFSLIAGFVDPGESLEDAVIREVWEEARVRVRSPKYLGSQPWPFPASLMLGFQADAYSLGEERPDGVEIRELRWFTRQELREATADGSVIVPGGVSISRAIIDAWLFEVV